MPDEVINKIVKWVNDQGYPLEMRVASAAQEKGFRVVQSEYYFDPESGDSRELDVLAHKQKQINNALFRVSLLIECKRSTDKPWVLFTSSKSLANPARVAQRAANSLGRRFLGRACQNDKVQQLPIFSVPERPAYGVTQAFTTGKDTCYSSVTSVSKAAFSTVVELDERKEKEMKVNKLFRKTKNICSIVFPVVVIDGALFEAYLNESSDVSVGEIKSGTLLWRNPVVGMPHTIVNIVCESALDEFLNDAVSSIDGLLDLAENDLLEDLEEAISHDNSPRVQI